MVNLAEKSRIGEMFIGDQTFERVHAARGDVGLGENLEPFRRGPGVERFGAHVEIGAHVGEPCLDGREARIVFQFRPADCVEQREGLSVGIGGHADMPSRVGTGLPMGSRSRKSPLWPRGGTKVRSPMCSASTNAAMFSNIGTSIAWPSPERSR